MSEQYWLVTVGSGRKSHACTKRGVLCGAGTCYTSTRHNSPVYVLPSGELACRRCQVLLGGRERLSDERARRMSEDEIAQIKARINNRYH